jgi:hypothetical protein
MYKVVKKTQDETSKSNSISNDFLFFSFSTFLRISFIQDSSIYLLRLISSLICFNIAFFLCWLLGLSWLMTAACILCLRLVSSLLFDSLFEL